MKYIISTFLIIVLCAISFSFGGKYYSKTNIKIVKQTKYVTKWKYKELKPEAKPVFDKENFDRLLVCYDSPIQFGHNIRKNEITVMAWDQCKDNQIKYEIASKHNYKMYLTFGVVGVGLGILAYKLIN